MKPYAMLLATCLIGCAPTNYFPVQETNPIHTVHQNAAFVIRSIAQAYGLQVHFAKDVDTITRLTWSQDIIIIGRAPLASVLEQIESNNFTFDISKTTLYVHRTEVEQTPPDPLPSGQTFILKKN